MSRIFKERQLNTLGAEVDFGGGDMRHVRVFLVVLIVLMSVPAWSQTTTGRLMGTTVDESGAVLPIVRLIDGVSAARASDTLQALARGLVECEGLAARIGVMMHPLD